jgi:ATP-binding cassette subfamily B protein
MTIDDHEDAREALRLLLELEGARVLAFAGGREALQWFEGRPASGWPQLLICDISLGEEDGYSVMRELRRLEAARGLPLEQRLPAVALTGHAQAGDRIRALMAGFQVHLAKPVDPAELVSTLAALAGRAERPSAAAVVPPAKATAL